MGDRFPFTVRIVRLLQILLFFYSLPTQSTIFLPIPIEKQLSESDGVVQGTYTQGQSKRMPNGEVVTQASFTQIKVSGLGANEVLNPTDLKIYIPGGVWNGIVYQIQGAPKFEEGKEYILLVKKGQYGLILSNFTLGQYSILEDSHERYIRSEVFPEDGKLGKMSYNKFNALVQKMFGEEILPLGAEKSVVISKNETSKIAEEAKRSPSSTESGPEINDIETNKKILFWHVVILASLASISILAKMWDKRK